MPVTWKRTPLSTTPASHTMADTDTHVLPFPAPFEISDVAVEMVVNGTLEDASDLVESATVNDENDGAVVVVSGLTRDTTYQLIVTMTPTLPGSTATGVLIINCVA